MGVTGAPFDAYQTLRGLRTLRPRVRSHLENTTRIVEALAGHPAVSVVHYPGLPEHPGHEIAARQQSGFGSVVSFELEGGEPAVRSSPGIAIRPARSRWRRPAPRGRARGSSPPHSAGAIRGRRSSPRIPRPPGRRRATGRSRWRCRDHRRRAAAAAGRRALRDRPPRADPPRSLAVGRSSSPPLPVRRAAPAARRKAPPTGRARRCVPPRVSRLSG